MKDHNVTQIPTDSIYIKTCVFSNVVQKQSQWDFDLEVGSGRDVPFHVKFGIPHSDSFDYKFLSEINTREICIFLLNEPFLFR